MSCLSLSTRFRRWLLKPILDVASRIEEKENLIMSKISEFSDRQQQRNDAITASLNGIQGDLQTLADLIAQLQSTQGAITPEDQALLDQIEATTEALKTRVSDIDAENPSPTPPNP